jgi:hypothetical protein
MLNDLTTKKKKLSGHKKKGLRKTRWNIVKIHSISSHTSLSSFNFLSCKILPLAKSVRPTKNSKKKKMKHCSYP